MAASESPIASDHQLASSFRDPSGFIYRHNGVLLRQIEPVYQPHYDRLMQSALYDELVRDHLLVPHEEVDLSAAAKPGAYKVIRPQQVPFIAYPHEWSFSQYKASALVTLEIQKRALNHGMSLKDASAYNLALVEGTPRLIDTLSFENYESGSPWIAYRQFCQHFLAPLALMFYRDIRLSQLLVTHIDGIPVDLASRLLPRRSSLNLAVLLHIHSHARAQNRYADHTIKQQTRVTLGQKALLGLIDNLESAIRKWEWKPAHTAWADYYDQDSYTQPAFQHKMEVVEGFIKQVAPDCVWDLGANTGVFSRLASQKQIVTVSMDFDPGAVELNYRQMLKDADPFIYPIVIDLTVPTPAIGWANRERDSLLGRGPADLVLALALIHHLAITNNVPLTRLLDFFAQLGPSAVVEFVPKEDPKTQKLLANRQDIFPDYTEAGFEAACQARYTIEQKVPVHDSRRCLYLLRVRN